MEIPARIDRKAFRMWRWSTTLLIGLAVMTWSPFAAYPQTAAERDPMPLARPTPMVIIETGEAAKLLNAVSKTIKDQGFEITRLIEDDGQIEATRPVSNRTQYRVLVWLERDFVRPTARVKLYFDYGRYEPVFGFADPQRIKVNSMNPVAEVARLKQALLDLRNFRGGQP